MVTGVAGIRQGAGDERRCRMRRRNSARHASRGGGVGGFDKATNARSPGRPAPSGSSTYAHHIDQPATHTVSRQRHVSLSRRVASHLTRGCTLSKVKVNDIAYRTHDQRLRCNLGVAAADWHDLSVPLLTTTFGLLCQNWPFCINHTAG